jgi:hypothetical protein
MAVHAKLIFSRYLDVIASDLLTIKSISLSTYRRLSYTMPSNKSFFAEIIEEGRRQIAPAASESASVGQEAGGKLPPTKTKRLFIGYCSGLPNQKGLNHLLLLPSASCLLPPASSICIADLGALPTNNVNSVC